ncbi:hypothetical protein PR048_029962 [Dryococelus australis]|uniref:Uncharacterized protein n=1 Tax=Dryococelus australis TaxID=614101 RepID=A0ABQ9G7M6_9NEOP|nr:hypothetical protein PR048_029962 [Dryococelus australis]
MIRSAKFEELLLSFKGHRSTKNGQRDRQRPSHYILHISFRRAHFTVNSGKKKKALLKPYLRSTCMHVVYSSALRKIIIAVGLITLFTRRSVRPRSHGHRTTSLQTSSPLYTVTASELVPIAIKSCSECTSWSCKYITTTVLRSDWLLSSKLSLDGVAIIASACSSYNRAAIKENLNEKGIHKVASLLTATLFPLALVSYTKDEAGRLFVFCTCTQHCPTAILHNCQSHIVNSDGRSKPFLHVVLAGEQFNVGTWRFVVRSQRDQSTSSLVYAWHTIIEHLLSGLHQKYLKQWQISHQTNARFSQICWGRRDIVVRPLASHLGELASIPGGVAPRFSDVGIVSYDASGRRVFSHISPPPPPQFRRPATYSPRFILICSPDIDVKSRLNLATPQICCAIP